MVLLDVVYLSMNRNRSYASASSSLMEDTTLEIELHIRYCNPVFIGLLFSKMPVILSCLAMNVRIGNISRRQEMPMKNYTLVIELFDVWAFDYMGPVPASNGYTQN